MFDERAGDRQPQTRSSRGSRVSVDADVSFEDSFTILLLNTRSGVGHFDQHLSENLAVLGGKGARRQEDLSPVGREHGGVAQQVCHDL